MDISKASNFERFVFDLLGRDGARGRASCSATQLAAPGRFDLSADPAFAQAAHALRLRQRQSTHADRLATIRDT